MRRNRLGQFARKIRWGRAMGWGVMGGIVLALMLHAEVRVSYETQRVEAKEEPRVVLIEVHPTALNKIADCESGERRPDGTAVPGSARHYNEDGSVKTGQFTDPAYGTDVGKYQINTKYHLKRAQRIGLDIYDEQDNASYARHLYRQEGTEPWNASRACWSDV